MTATSLPTFTDLDITHFVDTLSDLLSKNTQAIATILQENTLFTWDNLMRPLEDMDNELDKLWSPLSHLHAVVNSPALRDCYEACLPKISAYETAMGHNQALYHAVKSIDQHTLDKTQCKIIDDTLRDFLLSGISLSEEHKRRFETISARLSDLSNQFENNILDSVHAYQLHITDAARLTGIPQHALHNAQALAKEKSLPGWVLTLEYPCYQAVVTYAEDRALREELYKAFVTRASDHGPTKGQFDNTEVMNEMLALKHEKANLLGFSNYAELSLATKMASSTQDVMHFLLDLSQRAHGQAETEFNDLCNDMWS